jgi:hypothetical protein
MSAVVGGIGPVSVRYAIQIKQLLFAQTIQKMVADDEAARQSEVETRAAEAARAAETSRVTNAFKVDAQPAAAVAPPVETKAQVETAAPAQLVDIQA